MKRTKIVSSWIVLSLICSSGLVATAQTEGLDDLSLDELLHVDINKSSNGILAFERISPFHINVGLLVPYSKYKEYSAEIINATNMAANEINLQGGVLGKSLRMISVDDASTNEFALTYADSLVNSFNVAALIGPTGSGRVLHLAKELLPKRPVVIISPSASSNEISELQDDDLVWRTVPSDALQANVASDYIFNELKSQKVAVLYSTSTYGKGLFAQFKKSFKGNIVAEVSYSDLIDVKTFDFSEKIKAVFDKKPQAVYLITNGADASIISQKIAAARIFTKKYKPVLFGCDAMKGKDFLEGANPAIVNSIYGTALASKPQSTFAEKFKTHFGNYPVSSEAERAYDIVYLLALAIEKGGSIDHTSIKTELRSITEGSNVVGAQEFRKAIGHIHAGESIAYKGTSDQIAFDRHGDIRAGVFEIWTVRNGKFETVKIATSDAVQSNGQR